MSKRIIWDEEREEELKSQWTKKSPAWLEEYWGISYEGLRMKMRRMRLRKADAKKGTGSRAEVGDTRIRIYQGQPVEVVKCANGRWRRVSAVNRKANNKKKKPKPPQQMKPMTLPNARPARRGPKQQPHKYKQRKVDLTDKVPVHIPQLKMTVWVAKGTDTDAVRKKYIDNSLFNPKRYTA